MENCQRIVTDNLSEPSNDHSGPTATELPCYKGIATGAGQIDLIAGTHFSANCLPYLMELSYACVRFHASYSFFGFQLPRSRIHRALLLSKTSAHTSSLA